MPQPHPAGRPRRPADGGGRWTQWPWAHCARTTLAAVASLYAARLCRLPEAYWAPLTTLVVTQSSLGAALAVSRQRFLGTALGAGAAAAAGYAFGLSVPVFAGTIFVLGLLCAALGTDRSAYRFAGLTLAIVMLIPRERAPWAVAVHRFVEVSIGLGVALAVTTFWPEGPERGAGPLPTGRPSQ